MATGGRVCPPVTSNMGMICGAFKRLKNRDKMVFGTSFRGIAQR
jgi:hypothetical protein